jgi:hypothetical protein
LDNLTNNRPLDWDNVLSWPVVQFLNQLAYRKEKDARDAEAMKQNR